MKHDHARTSKAASKAGEPTSADDARDLLRRVRRIRLRTRHVVSAALAGQYHSAFKGRGMEFEEVRPYQIGDDVRSIDWNVSARLGEPHIKLFREERELTVMLAVDVSGSLAFGTTTQFKRDVVAELVATGRRGDRHSVAGEHGHLSPPLASVYNPYSYMIILEHM